MTNETNARYEVAILNNEGNIETLHCNDLSVIGGYTCSLERMQLAHWQGEKVAFCYDDESKEHFYLRAINW